MIETYNRKNLALIPIEPYAIKRTFGWCPHPGDAVIYRHGDKTLGLVVGVTAKKITVLWPDTPITVVNDSAFLEFSWVSQSISRQTMLRLAGLPDAEDVPQ